MVSPPSNRSTPSSRPVDPGLARSTPNGRPVDPTLGRSTPNNRPVDPGFARSGAGTAAVGNRDVFQAGAVATPAPAGQPDKAYDGFLLGAGGKAYPPSTNLDSVPAYKPQDGRAPNDTIVFVNGMGSSKANSEGLCQQVANVTGAQVVGVDNATEGTLKDLLQCTTDTLHFGKDPAVDTLSDVIYSKMKAGQPLHVMGFSQGAIITSNAIQNAQNRLMLEDGLSQAQVQQRMHDLLKVETIAGGAHTFPDGPKYVHYINNTDLVADTVGLNSHLPIVNPGAGAKEIKFTDWGKLLDFNPFKGHNFDMYMKRWQPFDQAYGA